VSVMINLAGDNISSALARATSTPANLLRQPGDLGRIGGSCRNVMYFADDMNIPTVLH
jgi:N-acetylglucosamine-6-phosphate deacetylase